VFGNTKKWIKQNQLNLKNSFDNIRYTSVVYSKSNQKPNLTFHFSSKMIAGWAMDLLVPCIVEGRSELRNTGRVNCKTHFGPFISFLLIWKRLRNTLLTERMYRFCRLN